MSTRLNLLILTDMEGLAGVNDIGDLERDTPRFAASAARLAAEINLAVAAAYDAGATRVYYLDGHGGADNLGSEPIDPRATACSVAEWQALLARGELDCLVELGAHARAGTQNAFLDHTISSQKIFSISVNGREMSECTLQAILCAKYGVPIVALTGDEAACAQARNDLPGIFTGAVKQAQGRNRAVTYPNADEVIYNTVKKGLLQRTAVPLIAFCEPLTVTEVFCRADYCERALAKCGGNARRLDARTLEKQVATVRSYSDLKF